MDDCSDLNVMPIGGSNLEQYFQYLKERSGFS